VLARKRRTIKGGERKATTTTGQQLTEVDTIVNSLLACITRQSKPAGAVDNSRAFGGVAVCDDHVVPVWAGQSNFPALRAQCQGVAAGFGVFGFADCDMIGSLASSNVREQGKGILKLTVMFGVRDESKAETTVPRKVDCFGRCLSFC